MKRSDNMNMNFDWIDFYKEFGNALLEYKSKRHELIQKIKNVFSKIGRPLPTLEEKGRDVTDIDPFTVYGLFNKVMRDSERYVVACGIKTEFSLKSEVPQHFDGIPTLIPLNATFYGFMNDRGEKDIENYWDLLESALNYAKNKSGLNKKKFEESFDKVINQKYGGNRVTMALYWVNPEEFLNLDSRNRWYIYESGKIPENVVNTLPQYDFRPTATQYLDIIEKMKNFLTSKSATLHDFVELSTEAWRYSEEINQQHKKDEQNSNDEGSIRAVHYWVYSPGENAYLWEEFYKKGLMGIGWGEIGDMKQYASKEEIKDALKMTRGADFSYKNSAHSIWQFVNEMKPGDIIFVKKGMHTLIGRGVIAGDYFYDENQKEFANFRKVNWTKKGQWQYPGQAPMKTLTDLTQYNDIVEKLNAIFESEDEEPVEEKETARFGYNRDKFLNDVYISAEEYETLTSLLKRKRNIILQGPPGVGKTFAATKLAYAFMGEQDGSRVMIVQFHQSYSYEDFVMGYKPTENGFERRNGIFYNFCKKAEIDNENSYFFIIDEINRGNISKIFGELFMLIESDKRTGEIQLTYSDEKFSIPENVYIIGTMNTADRSLAILDYALRRRFAFFEMRPAFDSEGFKKYQESLHSPQLNNLIACVEVLNRDIKDDESLGEGFCIGHSYFCGLKQNLEKQIFNIVEYELIPLLKEYWFDDANKVKIWADKLRSSIK